MLTKPLQSATVAAAPGVARISVEFCVPYSQWSRAPKYAFCPFFSVS
jgi:hypothetical protein